MLTKYAEVEAATESKKAKAAAVRIIGDSWLRKRKIWYWDCKNKLNSKLNAFPRIFHEVVDQRNELLLGTIGLSLPKFGPTSISIISRGTVGL